jgi:hypothetical protein
MRKNDKKSKLAFAVEHSKSAVLIKNNRKRALTSTFKVNLLYLKASNIIKLY